MSKEYCSLFEDILPLYKEGGLKDETKVIIEDHLKICRECFELYNEDFENIFADVEIEGQAVPKEKKFFIRLKKTLIFILGVILVTFITANALTYAAGKYSGIYYERFRLAEQNNLFLEINKEMDFGNEKILLEKVLLDSTVTSIIFKTSIDMNTLDSITLKDDKDNYYSKTHTLFNSVPLKYQNLNGYTILNFKSVASGTKELVIELIDWKKGSQKNEYDKRVIFNVPVNPESAQKSISDNSNVFKKNFANIVFTIDRVIRSASQTEICYKFNYEKSKYDGVALGWYHKEYIDNKDKISVKDTLTGIAVKVLSTEDISHEILINNPELRKTSASKILLNPLPDGIKTINLEYKDVYGYYSLNNQEIKLSLTNASSINISKTITAANYILDILSAEKKEGKIIINYRVTDNTGKIMKDVILDARINIATDLYAVPEEGKYFIGNEENMLTFENVKDGNYILSLARLGEKIDMGKIEFNIN